MGYKFGNTTEAPQLEAHTMFDFACNPDPLDPSEATADALPVPRNWQEEPANGAITEPEPRRDTFCEMISKGYLPG